MSAAMRFFKMLKSDFLIDYTDLGKSPLTRQTYSLSICLSLTCSSNSCAFFKVLYYKKYIISISTCIAFHNYVTIGGQKFVKGGFFFINSLVYVSIQQAHYLISGCVITKGAVMFAYKF